MRPPSVIKIPLVGMSFRVFTDPLFMEGIASTYGAEEHVKKRLQTIDDNWLNSPKRLRSQELRGDGQIYISRYRFIFLFLPICNFCPEINVISI